MLPCVFESDCKMSVYFLFVFFGGLLFHILGLCFPWIGAHGSAFVRCGVMYFYLFVDFFVAILAPLLVRV